jgi:hypothetical protein
MSSIPYGALTGFLLPADIREVAEHYGVRATALRAASGRAVGDDRVLEAFDALQWKLTRDRGLSLATAAALLGTDIGTVRAGVAAHEARLAVHYRQSVPPMSRTAARTGL